MDRWWLKGVDEGRCYILWHVLICQFFTYYLLLGFFTCNCWPCSFQNGEGHSSIPWLLLHCSKRCTWRNHTQQPSECSREISQLSYNISGMWGSPTGVFIATSACNGSLFLNDSFIWCPKWPVFINHWVETHQGSQGALEAIEPLWGDHADDGH